MAIIVYGTGSCTQCAHTKKYLESKEASYKYVDVFEDRSNFEKLTSRGFSSLPVVSTMSDDGEETFHFSGFKPKELDTLINKGEAPNA